MTHKTKPHRAAVEAVGVLLIQMWWLAGRDRMGA